MVPIAHIKTAIKIANTEQKQQIFHKALPKTSIIYPNMLNQVGTGSIENNNYPLSINKTTYSTKYGKKSNNRKTKSS
jgi:hypothetical protein